MPNASMYLIAVLCPPEINDKIHAFKIWMKEQFGCVVALKSPAHITLVPPFWVSFEESQQLFHCFNSFKFPLTAFEVRLKGFDHFSKKVLFVDVCENENLHALKAGVEKFFAGCLPGHVRAAARPFHPHVTIANRDMKPSHFERAWNNFSRKNFDKTFSIINISLLQLIDGKWNVIDRKEVDETP
jgi:2'-5' RNA ligase